MAKQTLQLNGRLGVEDLKAFTFSRSSYAQVQVNEKLFPKIQFSYDVIQKLIQSGAPIYGVTTGFGDSANKYIKNSSHAQNLQKNLIQYLSCGQGRLIPVEASRAQFLIRLNSLCQGISGVSLELIERMRILLENDVIPVVPCEGSLGASGDLVPLAYLGQIIQGYGEAYFRGEIHSAKSVLTELGLGTYELKPKEGLAIVNGTSTMAGMVLYNLKLAEYLVELAEIATAWQCLLLNGKREAFGAFINEQAKTNPGQKLVAQNIRQILIDEKHNPRRGQEVKIENDFTQESIQDPYSLRCVPQILGPIRENLSHGWEILEHEINSVTDNPVVDNEGQLEMGGNFYGGYLCQSMDFLKINLAHMADLADRQVLMIVSEKFNRGLPANLIHSEGLPASEHHIHHGLKGVHQTVGAITSEVIQKSIPNGIFSRSSESHNQDKVSLGMSASMSCLDMLEGLYKILGMQMVCLAQAIDLKKINLQGDKSKDLYQTVRNSVAFLAADRSLGQEIHQLVEVLKNKALKGNR